MEKENKKAYPLIIFGAGASFDYIHNTEEDPNKSNYKPPLTKDIFSKKIRGISSSTIDKYEETKPLIGELNSAVRNGKNFEQHLTEVRDRSPKRKGQLTALQYYLHSLFRFISNKYGEQIGNNYEILIEQIKESFPEACFVSFNYDTLFDRSLFPKKEISNINTYIHDNYKLIKVHGSCNWVYEIPFNLSVGDPRQIYEFLIKKPEEVEQISNSEKISIWNSNDPEKGYPAIALPLADKSDSHFVCPKEHLKHLTDAISKTDRILIIGWSSSDPALIKLIRDNLKNPTKLYIVCGTDKNITASVKTNFQGIPLLNVVGQTDSSYFFSDLPNSDYLNSFIAS